MRKWKKMSRRLGISGVALLLVYSAAVLTLSGAFYSPSALAYGQLAARSITMSNSSPSATDNLLVSFTTGSTSTTGSIVVNFCQESPLYAQTCTTPTSMSVSSATLTTGTNTSGWTVGTNTANTFELTGGTAINTNTPVTFTITGAANPSTTGSFYARIYGYNGTSYGSYSSPISPGTVQDFGGIALATTQNVIVTSKVFETLSFCVYQSACGTQAQLALGDSTTGALSTSTAYANINAKYTLATNAASGVSVQMFGTTLCRVSPLNYTNCPTGSSANTISAIGSSQQTVNSGSYGPGHEAFGMCVNAIAGTTAAAPYADTGTGNNCNTGISTGIYSGSSKFGFNDTNSTGTNSASGSTVLTSAGPVSSANSQFAFVANIAPITEAGIYQSNLNMVATGTF